MNEERGGERQVEAAQQQVTDAQVDDEDGGGVVSLSKEGQRCKALASLVARSLRP